MPSQPTYLDFVEEVPTSTAGDTLTSVKGLALFPSGGRWYSRTAAGIVKALAGITSSGTVAPGDLAAFSDSSGLQVQRSGRGVQFVSILDFGADRTGQTSITAALTAAINALGAAGGVVEFPAGTYLETSSPYVVSANNITFSAPAGPNATTLKTTNTTGDQYRFTGYGSRVIGFSVQGPGSGTTSSKTSGVGLDMQSTEGQVTGCNFTYQYDCLAINGFLVDADDLFCRYFTRNGINVTHNSDHRITHVTMDNNAATLPTGAGISVTLTASLILERLNIIHSNLALDLAPASGVTVPSIKASDCFFDTSAVGLNMTSAGSVFRSEFTNCWFSSMSAAGIRLTPASGGTVDGVSFVNCSIYNNVAGTTVGIDTNAQTAGWRIANSNIAGWTTGINLVAGTNHIPMVIGNRIGPISAFGANTTGIVVGAGTYRGFMIANNEVVGNTTALTLGAFVVPTGTGTQFRIMDNAGINPRGATTTPTFPTSTTVVANTTGFRVLIRLSGGTATAYVINGVATGLAAASTLLFPLDPGGTVAVTYSVAPTWVWIAQ